ncbi:GGDEF domain-containing phosphodiesterase [Pleurocapsa sp. PCC 7319]|uniref:bifunctional diguanylate cyclase/phosphodiesterase n=1 Tax=Pleurocapsa sp. PCC 7319 TaxID=118161 RepID=UPI00034C1446|nr:GGDEF domain-containing phosphodiesterase [Pleurocapsa sp. PCC 7319]
MPEQFGHDREVIPAIVTIGMPNQELAEILQQQNSLLNRVEIVLAENQQLRTKFQELTEREERFRQIAENVREVFFVISAKTDEILYISPTYEKVWGRTCQSLYEDPQSWLFAIHPEDSYRAIATIETQFRTGDDFEEEYRIIRPDQSICWVRVRAFPVTDVMGKVNRFVGIAEDITKRREAEEALKKSEEQFRLTFEMAPIGMAISTLTGEFQRVNQALCDALGYTQEELLKLSFAEISHPEDCQKHRALEDKLIQGEESDFQIEKRYLAKDGRIVDTLLKVVIVRDAEGKPLHFNNQIVDITERKYMEKQLLHDALHDALTGLPNRALFMDRLERQLKRSQNQENYLFAVLFLDLDRFKVVNDSVGHLIGDKLLIEIASRLEKSVAPTDTVARLGGDEFTILLENISSKSEATLVAESIYQTLTFPFNIEGYELFTSASIGIALSSQGYETPQDILRDADLTMYSAKEQGKARYEVFDCSLRDRALQRLELETDLRRALERQEFEVYYQPITSLQLGILSAFEALVRWKHPTKGYIKPDNFIPLCEETGLIVPLGSWLLREACQTARNWQLKYPDHPPIRMSVNLSGQQFREPHLIEEIDSVLKETGLEGKFLKLEITESILIDNLETVTEIILNLRKRQIQFSIDDFGTGYSSLSYLHRFPVDTIKIDRSFVSQMQADGDNSAIVKAIITLAHMLDMDVIAEGIETTSQLAQLRLLQCEYGQGFFFSKPLNQEQAEALIASSPKW